MSLKSNILKIDPKFWHYELGNQFLRYGVTLDIADSYDFDYDVGDGLTFMLVVLTSNPTSFHEVILSRGNNFIPPEYKEEAIGVTVIIAQLGAGPIPTPEDIQAINPQILVDVDPVVMNRLLLNKEDFECIAQVAKHCDWEQLCLYIREQQNLTLLPLVGDCIFNLLMQDEEEWSDEIKNLWHGSTFEGCGGDNRTHFGLKMSLIHWAYGAYVYRHSAVDTPFGVVQKVGRESVPVEISQLRAINKEQRENADFYFERTKEYLCKIKSDVGCGSCDCICNYCSNNGRKVQNRGFKFRLVSKKI